MKYRTDFVSNSSSSSFVIQKKNLTENQMRAIRNHIPLGKKLNVGCALYEDKWDIDENETKIWGSTWMDNFSMNEFFEKIDINDSIVKWSEFLDDKDTVEYDWEELLNEI